MDDLRDSPLPRVSAPDWLELGERLDPTNRHVLLGLLEHEVSKLGTSRENLRQIERMLADGAALLDEVRGLRGGARLEPDDQRRIDAVIHTIEQAQRLFASHYAGLVREWLLRAGPLGDFQGPAPKDEE